LNELNLNILTIQTKLYNMKRILQIISAGLIFTSTAMAQIPNAGFESWTQNSPDGWATLNSFGVSMSAEKAEGHTGSAIKLTTIAIPAIIGVSEADTLPGTAITGSLNGFDIRKAKTGFPFQSRPENLTGYYKYTSLKLDVGFITMVLFKWNANLKQRDTVAIAKFFTSGTVAAYTEFSTAFDYISTDTPDTAAIWLSSSSERPIPGSELYVDELATNGTITSTTNSVLSENIYGYPNPARDEFTISGLPDAGNTIEIKDATGRTIVQTSAVQYSIINTSRYPEGIYYYQIYKAGGTLIHSNKFSIMK
jgi:hypothetical protein